AAATPAATASVFASALIDADIGTQHFSDGVMNRLGGSLHKVVRWAFQQQGLYHSGSGDRDTPGAPPGVDIYVEGDAAAAGGYARINDWRAEPGAVWARNARDGGTGDEAPQAGVANFLYVEVGNQGAADASGVSVDVLTRQGPGHDRW